MLDVQFILTGTLYQMFVNLLGLTLRKNIPCISFANKAGGVNEYLQE
jgi:hypothetical protein